MKLILRPLMPPASLTVFQNASMRLADHAIGRGRPAVGTEVPDLDLLVGRPVVVLLLGERRTRRTDNSGGRHAAHETTPGRIQRFLLCYGCTERFLRKPALEKGGGHEKGRRIPAAFPDVAVLAAANSAALGVHDVAEQVPALALEALQLHRLDGIEVGRAGADVMPGSSIGTLNFLKLAACFMRFSRVRSSPQLLQRLVHQDTTTA